MHSTARRRRIHADHGRTPAPVRRSAPDRPLLTSDGRFLMQMRLTHLLEVAIPAARTDLDARRSRDGGITILERLCVEAVWLQRLLKRAGTLPPPSGDIVELGCYVRIRLVDGEGTWVRPVAPVEAMLGDDRLSSTSPLGSALLGAREGDTVVVQGPAGPWECTVLEIAPRDPEVLAQVG
jgi:transcription elongation GreA/GreB family factor